MMDPDPCVGILIVQDGQKAEIISHPDVRIDTYSRTIGVISSIKIIDNNPICKRVFELRLPGIYKREFYKMPELSKSAIVYVIVSVFKLKLY